MTKKKGMNTANGRGFNVKNTPNIPGFFRSHKFIIKSDTLDDKYLLATHSVELDLIQRKGILRLYVGNDGRAYNIIKKWIYNNPSMTICFMDGSKEVNSEFIKFVSTSFKYSLNYLDTKFLIIEIGFNIRN